LSCLKIGNIDIHQVAITVYKQNKKKTRKKNPKQFSEKIKKNFGFFFFKIMKWGGIQKIEA
jgi:hypothetical protein